MKKKWLVLLVVFVLAGVLPVVRAGERTNKAKSENTADAIFAKYGCLARSKIMKKWNPSYECKTPKVSIHVTIDELGKISNSSIVSSEKKECEQFAVEALEKTSSLPPPPKQFKKEISEEGFLIELGDREPLLVSKTENNGVIFAAHPYLTKESRKDFLGISWLEKQKYLPVGFLIQNFSKDRIWIYQNGIRADSDRNFYTVPLSPFSKRPLGVIGGNQFFDDGYKLNRHVQEKFNSSEKLQPLLQNEIFYTNWIEPGTAYYGLLYLSLRNNNKQPIIMDNLNGVKLVVPFLDIKTNINYEAVVPLFSEEDSISIAEAKKSDSDKYYLGTSVFQTISKENKQISLEQMLDIKDSFFRCYSKSVGERLPFDKKWYGKKSAVATLGFNEYGENIFYLLMSPSGEKSLDVSMLRVAEGMKKCDYPGMKERKRGDYATGSPAFIMNVKGGDIAVSGNSRPIVEFDNEFIEFNRKLQEKVSTSYQPSAKCSGRKNKPSVQVSFKENKAVVDLIRSSGEKQCDSGYKETVEQILKEMNISENIKKPSEKLAVIDFNLFSPLLKGGSEETD